MGSQAATGQSTEGALLGTSPMRVEDAALVRGRGRYASNAPPPAGTLTAAVLRSPYAHAEITSVDATRALDRPGVFGVLTGRQVADWSDPFLAVIRADAPHYALAVDRVRHVGEPVAIVIATTAAVARDGTEDIDVGYETLDAVVDPILATESTAPQLHPGQGSNIVSDRQFVYGDPDRAFADAERRVGLTVRFPRNACTPIECGVVAAEYLPETGGYDVLANFQGPFTLHGVMARALRVSSAGLQLRTPRDSGGSFGTKQGLFPMIVAMALASRLAGRPVRWAEDRSEHMVGTAATNRVTEIEAAVDGDGRVRALRFDQVDDCGAYLRAPEPASLYRMHGTLTGAYAIQDVACRNRVVLTNKTPTGLNRGFGGPQHYFALERLMDRIAVELGLDPVDVRRSNLVAASDHPYRAAAGSILDSGDMATLLERTLAKADHDHLVRRRTDARADGRIYGIGLATVIEPSVSNMGYIATALTADERDRGRPKGGGVATATVGLDPTGAVTVQVASTPQGQGHRTVLAQVVGDLLGVGPDNVSVTVELDTTRDAWSIASGNYSSRFAGAVAGVVHRATMQLRRQLAEAAADLLELGVGIDVEIEDLRFADGRIHASEGVSISISQVAGTAHWSPAEFGERRQPGFRVTEFWSPAELAPPDAQDRINGSLCYGGVVDVCAIEIDPDTGEIRFDRYVTGHDAGRILNPAMADGQIHGSFAHAVGAALYEEIVYDADGNLLTPGFAHYAAPSAVEIPPLEIVHMETPSPFTPLGAKGLGEGNCMSTPVCIANAVADALGLADITLPLTPERVVGLVRASRDSTQPSTEPEII